MSEFDTPCPTTVDTAELERLDRQIEADKQVIRDACLRLGKAYFDAHKNDPPECMEDEVRRILDATEAIKQNRAQLRTCKGLKLCPACGTEIALSAVFCNYCGCRLQAPTSAPDSDPVPETEPEPIPEPEPEPEPIPEPEPEPDPIPEPEPEPAPEPEPEPAPEPEPEPAPEPEPEPAPEPEPEPIPEPNPEPQPRTCAVCGLPLRDTQKFCIGCGTPVPPREEPAVVEAPKPRTCANCGAELLESAKFCIVCGTRAE